MSLRSFAPLLSSPVVSTTVRCASFPVALVSLAALASGCGAAAATASGLSNKEIVTQAVTQLFINKDATAIDRFWDATTYIQHNPSLPNGAPRELLNNVPPNFKYELGLVVAEGPIVMVHGRYTGLASTPLIAVDIFRVTNGKLTEHWDVLQAETAADQTVSGNPMFSATEAP